MPFMMPTGTVITAMATITRMTIITATAMMMTAPPVITRMKARW